MIKSDVCNSLELALIDTDNDILFHDKTETVSKVISTGVTSSALWRREVDQPVKWKAPLGRQFI